jgi:hypothetical protein
VFHWSSVQKDGRRIAAGARFSVAEPSLTFVCGGSRLAGMRVGRYNDCRFVSAIVAIRITVQAFRTSHFALKLKLSTGVWMANLGI